MILMTICLMTLMTLTMSNDSNDANAAISLNVYGCGSGCFAVERDTERK